MDDLQIFLRYDPFLRCLLWLTQKKTLRLVLLAFGVCGIGCFFLGGILVYFSRSSYILSPFDSMTLPLEAYIYLLTLPTIWVYYAKEPQRISAIFSGLSRNKVIGQTKAPSYPTVEVFLKAQNDQPQQRWYTLVSLGLTITLFFLWWSTVFTPNNPFWFSHPQVWWQVHPLFFWMIWVPVVWGTVYMLWYTFFRRVMAVILINRFLKAFDFSPKLLHPDRANGFSPVGKYPLSFTFLVLVAGGWLFLVIVYPVFFGHPANTKLDTYIYILLYIILTSIGLLTPIWGIHKKMCELKHQALEEIAEEVRQLLKQMPSTLLALNGPLETQAFFKRLLAGKEVVPSHRYLTPKDLMENIEALKREYELINQEFHTWPFNLSSMSQFLVSFGFPFFTAAVSVIVPFLGK